ncbi:unnamed protein product [Spirodela intermedia]|uniref:Uncharacterized protein n=1 Tax=Spirodela intermedia TaxID=51605 RepID=A0A7I8KBD1_SPIIN|nr:unnamed protein product [Spirodela intermedia]
MASLFPASTPPRLIHGSGRRPSASSSPAATRVELPLAGDTIKVESLVDLQLKVGDTWQRLKEPADGGTAGELVLLRSSTGGGGGGGGERDEFYLNLGTAVRTLREDLPAVFSRDLNYDIYRADITFSDPLNAFHGIDNYRLIFWALRFHGRMLFRDIAMDVLRIWQLSDDVILVRWNLRGVPRVPWETRGEFQGTSRYKLDRRGKIYDHRVDNLAFNFPKMVAPRSSAAAVLDLVAVSPCPPVAGASFSLLSGGHQPGDGAAAHRCSWVEFYRAVKETLDHGKLLVAGEPETGLAACS